MKNISVQELSALLDEGSDLLLIDVRNPSEADVAVIPGSQLVPLARIETGRVSMRFAAWPVIDRSMCTASWEDVRRKPSSFSLCMTWIPPMLQAGLMPGLRSWIQACRVTDLPKLSCLCLRH